MELGLQSLLPQLAGILLLVLLGVLSCKVARAALNEQRWFWVLTKPVALFILALPHIALLLAGTRAVFPLETFLYFVLVGQALAAFTDSW